MERFDKKKFKNICLNGDYHQVIAYLNSVSDGGKWLTKYKAVFEGGRYLLKASDEGIAKLLRIYEDYLKWALTNETTTDQCKDHLIEKLSPMFPDVSDWDSLVETVNNFIKEKGYHGMLGVVLPYPNIMLWKKQTSSKVKVELPNDNVEIDVVRMGGVITRGWASYLSWDKVGAGGWVTDTGTNYFAGQYNTLSSEFKVSLLKHEAQHFHDLKNFPDMDSADLEYRAKLVEMIYHKKTSTLTSFIGRMGDEGGSDHKTNPHGHANRRIVQGLSNRIFGKELEVCPNVWKKAKNKIPAAARELFEEDNKKLKES